MNLIKLLKKGRKISQKDIAEINVLTLESIFKTVCDYYGFDYEAAIGRTKKRELVEVRQVFCFFARKNTDNGYNAIGKFIGKNHATAIYAVRTIENLVDSDKGVRIRVKEISNILNLQ